MKKLLVSLLILLIVFCAACGELTSDSRQPPDVPAAEEPAEPKPVSVPALVLPLPTTLNEDSLQNSTLAVSFGIEDMTVDEFGAYELQTTVWVYDVYDMVEMSLLQVGDTIRILNEDVLVESLERDERGTVIINGGLDVGGHEFVTAGDTVYYEIGYNDAKSYYPYCDVVVPVAEDFVFSDRSDLDNGEFLYTAQDFLTEALEFFDHFVPHNTALTLENGTAIHLVRNYMP